MDYKTALQNAIAAAERAENIADNWPNLIGAKASIATAWATIAIALKDGAS